MRNFETNYRVEGSAALKPNAHPSHRTAKIISFPGPASQHSAASAAVPREAQRRISAHAASGQGAGCAARARRSAFAADVRLYTGIDEAVSSLRSGSARGRAYGAMTRGQALAAGIAFSAFAIALALVSL